jgi:hypothetical protein
MMKYYVNKTVIILQSDMKATLSKHTLIHKEGFVFKDHMTLLQQALSPHRQTC